MSAQLLLRAIFLAFLLLYIYRKVGFQRSAPKLLGLRSQSWHSLLQFAGPKGQNAYCSKIIFNKIKYINE